MITRTCPLGHECDSCLWEVTMRGHHPQTGAEVDRKTCAMAAIPVLLIENSAQQRATAAAVESARNESVRDRQTLFQVLSDRPGEHLLGCLEVSSHE